MNHVSTGSRGFRSGPFGSHETIHYVQLDGKCVYQTTDERDCALFAAQLRAFVNTLGAVPPAELLAGEPAGSVDPGVERLRAIEVAARPLVELIEEMHRDHSQGSAPRMGQVAKMFDLNRTLQTVIALPAPSGEAAEEPQE